jgi:hypothetical protein
MNQRAARPSSMLMISLPLPREEEHRDDRLGLEATNAGSERLGHLRPRCRSSRTP